MASAVLLDTYVTSLSSRLLLSSLLSLGPWSIVFVLVFRDANVLRLFFSLGLIALMVSQLVWVL